MSRAGTVRSGGVVVDLGPALPVACNRKDNRTAFAKRIAEIAKAGGATAEIGPFPLEPRGVIVRVAFGDYRANIDFHPRQRAFFIHWHTSGRDAKYPRRFVGDVNTYHFGKATTVVETFGGLCYALERGLSMLSEASRKPEVV